MGFSPEFGDQLELHRRSLLRTALRLTGDPDRAEDLVQDTYVRALRSAHTFQTGTSLSAWLLRIEGNLFKDSIRNSKRRPKEVSLDKDENDDDNSPLKRLASGSSPEEVVLEKASIEIVTRILSTLPPGQSAAILLVDIFAHNYEQAARIMNIPRGTVASSLNRGRTALRRSLASGE